MAYFYDDVRMRLVEQRMEIENDRYYFINYCKKRKYQVTDDFYDCILQDGEVILSKIAPSFRELVPINFEKMSFADSSVKRAIKGKKSRSQIGFCFLFLRKEKMVCHWNF